jgi:valyl-tRNA synthetase
MDKTYDPRDIETRLYQDWEEHRYFAPAGTGPAYCIMLPPPNVTGNLHMGHAFQHTLMDILIRYHRMQGDRTLWQCGTDHAGIATQMVVERQLEQQGQSRHDLGREKFVQRVWDWKQEAGNTITRQLRRLGTSMDWSRERFTMDDGLSKAVQKVFIELYNEGLIYRGKRLVNWDPVLHTAISDLEVIAEEENGNLWHIRYPLADGSGHLIVATTRPETMLGDAAVAVHPEDERYKNLIGKQIDLPLTGRTIPIIADDYVDPEFGTGCVKITPAHDFNDYAVGQRHNLPLINIFTIDATIKSSPLDDYTFGHRARHKRGATLADGEGLAGPPTIDLIPKKYHGLDRFTARKKIVADLEAAGLLEKTEAHKLMVPRGDRSNAVIEPYLTDQWYVRIAPLAEPAIKAVEDGRIKFIPENWAKTYFEWMRNIQDWCISRQLWWGHQIPAWYDDQGKIYVGTSETEIRKREKLGADIQLKQDEDVLDTWFSSALWPFSTLDWPQPTEELKTFYPTSVLVTGFDIIFFWVARMIMMGLKFTGDVPFREVYVHGLVRDAEGHKMSKSKGNILDPLDLIDGIDLGALVQKRTAGLMRPQDAPKIEKATHKQFPEGIAAYGTDSLRLTFASLATQGRDIRFDTGRIGGYRNFCNKLWNATRYVMMSAEGQALDINTGGKELGLAERWIYTRLALTIDTVRDAIGNYRFDLATHALYEFTWDEYCDWYLELSKTTLTDPAAGENAKRGTLHTLFNVLEILLRLLHPFIPFITEELWQKVAPALNQGSATIMLQPYPAVADIRQDPESMAEINWVKSFILGVRRIRAERDIAPGKPLPVSIKGGNERERLWLDDNRRYLQTLAKVTAFTTVDRAPDDAVFALAGDMTLLVPLADLIDLDAEIERLQKEHAKLSKLLDMIRNKLGNENFVARAPSDVIKKERDKMDEAATALATIGKEIERIEKLKKH